MKKHIGLITLLALGLLASSATAAVRNTKHDLSSTSSGATIKSTNYSEVCVFCHTPHGAVTGMLAPLWNRGTSLPAAFTTVQLYNSATLSAEARPSYTNLLNNVNNSDARLCLSCHNESGVAQPLQNPANTSGGLQPTFSGAGTLGNNAVILNTAGSDYLQNDHPIGMVYSKAVSTDGELVASPAGGVQFFAGTGGDTGIMWCSSCHDVHGGEPGTPFLVTTNAGSYLCTSCHVK